MAIMPSIVTSGPPSRRLPEMGGHAHLTMGRALDGYTGSETVATRPRPETKNDRGLAFAPLQGGDPRIEWPMGLR